MEGPAQPLGVSYYTKYSSTDTLLTSVKSQKESSCPRHVMQTGGSSHYSLSQRLRLRKDMLHQRKRIVDISFMLGIAGNEQAYCACVKVISLTLSHVCVCVCVCEKEKEREGEKECLRVCVGLV